MQQLKTELLAHIGDAPLFYPHSGRDLLEPIELFAPVVKNFWFVDLGYFGLNCPADKACPVLHRKQDYILNKVEIKGSPAARLEQVPYKDGFREGSYGYIEPCVLTETYTHVESGRTINVHRRRGYGASALHKEINDLGVFFYRGDSSEGSNTPWLTVGRWSNVKKRKERWLFHFVLSKLVDGGFIVTDGSRCEGERNPYREFRRFTNNDTVSGSAVELARSFVDDDRRRFECVGYAGERYGPTLIWQVWK